MCHPCVTYGLVVIVALISLSLYPPYGVVVIVALVSLSLYPPYGVVVIVAQVSLSLYPLMVWWLLWPWYA